MNLSSLELEQRIERHLMDRARRQGQLAGLGDGELHGIFKKIRKAAKKIGKVVKKVAPIAVGAATAYVGGVAAARLTKKLISKKKKPAVPAQSQQVLEQAIDAGALPSAAPPGVGVADVAAQLAQYMMAQQGASIGADDPGMQQIYRDAMGAQSQLQQPFEPAPFVLDEVTVEGKRGWVVPVAIASGLGLLALAHSQRSRKSA